MEKTIESIIDLCNEQRDSQGMISLDKLKTDIGLLIIHQSKVNNGVLDDVKECLHPFNKVVSGDEGDFCTACQKYLKTNWL